MTGWNSSYLNSTLGSTTPSYNHHRKGFWSRSFYKLDRLPITETTASKHWRYVCLCTKSGTMCAAFLNEGSL